MSDSEILKVKNTSSRNAGSGSTIMASTTITSTGTPRPLRANSPKVATAPRALIRSRYSSPTLRIGRATRAAMVGFKVRTLKMYDSTCATATYSPLGISLFRSVERYSARASFGALEYRHAMFLGDAADVLRDQIDALRQHHAARAFSSGRTSAPRRSASG